jgi:hypothetical protein
LPRVIESTLVPLVLTYFGLRYLGLSGGLGAPLAWTYGAVIVRLLLRRRVSGMLIIGALSLAARTAAALATGSVFVYFLQPTLSTFLTGIAFAGSALVRRPLTHRLTGDLIPLPRDVHEHPAILALHRRLSTLWGATFAVNGAAALRLLRTQPVGTFLVGRTVAGAITFVAAVAVSVVAFGRCVRRHEIALSPTLERTSG